jgi:hypothetical protein
MYPSYCQIWRYDGGGHVPIFPGHNTSWCEWSGGICCSFFTRLVCVYQSTSYETINSILLADIHENQNRFRPTNCKVCFLFLPVWKAKALQERRKTARYETAHANVGVFIQVHDKAWRSWLNGSVSVTFAWYTHVSWEGGGPALDFIVLHRLAFRT